jgi:SAM-dependent methyltransferase
MRRDDRPDAQGSGYNYVGSELEVFKDARNWKRYWSSAIAPYLRGAVLEVGAGIGANTPFLLAPSVTRLVRLEPDAALLAQAPNQGGGSTTTIENRVGVLGDLTAHETFDTILYLDVLEHIERDRREIEQAAARLSPGGHLVVLAPAFQTLYSAFDKAIGHYRRYTRASLESLTPDTLTLRSSAYLDGPGAMLSAVNRLWLGQSSPTAAQIAFWDGWIVPLARLVDPLTRRLVGRSVLCVWQRPH